MTCVGSVARSRCEVLPAFPSVQLRRPRHDNGDVPSSAQFPAVTKPKSGPKTRKLRVLGPDPYAISYAGLAHVGGLSPDRGPRAADPGSLSSTGRRRRSTGDLVAAATRSPAHAGGSGVSPFERPTSGLPCADPGPCRHLGAFVPRARHRATPGAPVNPGTFARADAGHPGIGGPRCCRRDEVAGRSPAPAGARKGARVGCSGRRSGPNPPTCAKPAYEIA
jgi:hypothetical protein